MATDETPTFITCGVEIPLRDVSRKPNSITIAHTIPVNLREFVTQRREGKNFDVVVIFGEQRLNAHKVLLRARIPFFRALFNSNLAECTTGEVDLSSNVDVSDFTTVENLLIYAYNGQLVISEANAQALIMAANFFQMTPIVDECIKFMKERILFDNVLSLIALCRSVERDIMDDTVRRFIDKNFVPISETPEFLTLTPDEVVNLIERDSLYVDNEEQVFEAVSRWINRDYQSRHLHAFRLLSSIRCCRLSETYITETAEKEEWVKAYLGCKSLLSGAKTIIQQNAETRKPPTVAERVCDDAHRLIFSIGAGLYSDEVTLELYDPKSNCWIECPKQESYSGKSVAVLDQRIYFFGGFKTCLTTGDICFPGTPSFFDTIALEWNPMTPMLEKRANMAVGVINGKIYISGGVTGDRLWRISTTEVFDPEWQVWSRLAPMTKARTDAASCVLNGKLYVIGGIADRDASQLSSLQRFGYQQLNQPSPSNDGECYDPEIDRWTPIAPMHYSRKCCAAAALGGKIYVVGGTDANGDVLDCLERYDPETDSWTTIRSMKRKRSGATLLVSCGHLFVLGGSQLRDTKASVEMYDPERDTWVDRASMIEQSDDVYVGVLAVPATFPSRLANVKM